MHYVLFWVDRYPDHFISLSSSIPEGAEHYHWEGNWYNLTGYRPGILVVSWCGHSSMWVMTTFGSTWDSKYLTCICILTYGMLTGRNQAGQAQNVYL